MIQRYSSILVSASFALLAACGGDDGGSTSTPSAAFETSIEASCQKAFDCMSSYDAAMHNGTAFADSYGASVSACVAQTRAFIDQFLGADYLDKLDASASAGRIDFDSADAQTCLDATTGQTCDQFFDQNGATFTPPAACDTALVGTVATGGACTIDEDCATEGDDCDPATMTCAQ
jgi:hypothetical protein